MLFLINDSRRVGGKDKPNNTPKDKFQDNLREMIKIGRDLAEDVPYLDLWPQWVRKYYRGLLFEDGLHPNSQGHQKIFLAVRDYLKELFE